MTIIDSERKRPDPVVELGRILSEARGCEHPYPCGFCHWSPDDMTKAVDETGCIWIAEAVLSRLNQLGMLNEAYYEALKEAKRG